MREEGVRDFAAEQETPVVSPSEQMPDDLREDYLRKAREMVLVQEQKKRVSARESALKPDLMGILEKFGDPVGDEGQHRTIDFPKPIRGIARFVRQRKVTHEVDEISAEVIARKRGLYDRLYKPVMTLDQDAVDVALAAGELSEEDVAKMFPSKVSYAFVPEKAKKR